MIYIQCSQMNGWVKLIVPFSWKYLSKVMFADSEGYRGEVSWADRCESPPGLVTDVLRSPGRAIHLHQRLSSPSRKRSVIGIIWYSINYKCDVSYNSASERSERS